MFLPSPDMISIIQHHLRYYKTIFSVLMLSYFSNFRIVITIDSIPGWHAEGEASMSINRIEPTFPRSLSDNETLA